MVSREASRQSTNYRAVALPTEHGGWGFLIEPLLLGVLLAFTWQAVLLSVAMFGIFLTHQPMKLALKDHSKAIRTRRTKLAERFTVLYAAIALVCFVPVLMAGIPSAFWAVAGVMLALVMVQHHYDLRNKSRELVPEVAGALALGGSVSLIALLVGWDWVEATILWVLLGARAVPAILYVRSAFRKQRGKPHHIVLTYSAHGISIGMAIGLAWSGLVPLLAVVAMVILLGRAYHILHAPITLTAKALGFREMGYGFLTVFLIAIGYWLML